MATINWGSITTLHNNTSNNSNCCQINDNLIAVVYRVGSNQYIDIIEFSADSHEVLSHNATDTSLQSARDNYQAICKVTDNKFAVAYNRNADVRVHLYYWNGSSLIDYGEDLGSGADSDYHELVQIEDNKIMLFFRSSDEMKAIVATCNDGVNLTWGNFYVPVAYNLSYISAVKIGSGKVMCAFRNSGATDLEVMVLSSPAGLNDRTLSYGSKYDIETNLVTYYISTASYENDRAIVTYGVSGASYGYAVACSISGTVIDIGTRKDFESGETLNTSVAKCHAVEDAFLVAYEDANDSHKGKTRELIVNWSSGIITLGDEQIFSENSTGGGFDHEALSFISTNNGRYFIAFCDATDSYYAKYIIDFLDTPTNVSIVEGEIKNTVSWDAVTGIDNYNLYWLKYEFFGDLFTSLDNWNQYKDVGTETIEINSEKLRFSNSSGSGCHVVNKKELPSGDFDIEIELVTYTPDDSSNGQQAILRTIDVYPYTNVDGAEVYYYVSNSGSTHNIVSNIWINSVLYNVATTASGQPTKLRITRVGNIITTYYEYSSVWTSVDNQDFSTRSSNVVIATLDSLQTSGNGGLTEFDNFDFYVDVVSLGTKIPTIYTESYEHSGLDYGDNYIYVVTAEDLSGETDPSDIANGVPDPISLETPVISGIPGDSENIITISECADATKYNLYYNLTSGVTKNNGIKLEDITLVDFIYNHIELIRQNYYYVATSENISEESIESNEICLKPDFEGKIFDHIEQIKNSLLYQYKDKD